VAHPAQLAAVLRLTSIILPLLIRTQNF